MKALARLLRPAALVAAAAIVVHELRFAIGFGAEQGALRHVEHAYLPLGLSLAALLLVAAAAAFARELVRARHSSSGRGRLSARPDRLRSAPRGRPSFLATWLSASAVLAAVYVGQELLEPLLASGHPGGLTGVLDHAGWSAFPFSLALGGLVALLLRGAGAAIERAAGRTLAAARRPIETARAGSPERGASWTGQPVLALHLAGRAPPPLSR